RTPVGRYGGALASVRPDDLAALAIRAVVDRSGIDPALVEDVILGCANQAGEDNRNVARMAVLLAGLPVEVAGQTVNRLCGSGLQAINAAAHAIAVDDGDMFIAGGVESMTRAPFVLGKAEAAWDRGATNLQDTTLGWRFPNPKLSALHHPYSMGETAENVVERYGSDRNVTRERQDAFALRSHQRAIAAIEGGVFDDQIVPVPVPQKKGEPVLVARDEHPRADTSMEALARLRPAFREGGSVTAGNSSGIVDGAAIVLLGSGEWGKKAGQKPRARIRALATAGSEPVIMLTAPAPASAKALKKAGMTVKDIDLWEINEAFAVVPLQTARALGIDHDRINVNGGAIALGHPLGATGAILLGTALDELERTNKSTALITLCIGGGMGIATIIERV
ncbi:MAG: thiolase family protein, partial [bacterium]